MACCGQNKMKNLINKAVDSAFSVAAKVNKAMNVYDAVTTQLNDKNWVTGIVADSRTRTCAECPLNITEQKKRGRPKKGVVESIMDAGAMAIAATVPEDVYGSAEDASLVGKCGACGCDLKAKVHFSDRATKRAVSLTELDPYWIRGETEPKPGVYHEDCWVRELMLG
jgi:hypothetical protein